MAIKTTLGAVIEKERRQIVCDNGFQDLIEFLDKVNTDESHKHLEFVRCAWLERDLLL